MWPLTESSFPEPTGEQRLHVEQLGIIHLHLAGGLVQNPHKVSGQKQNDTVVGYARVIIHITLFPIYRSLASFCQREASACSQVTIPAEREQ